MDPLNLKRQLRDRMATVDEPTTTTPTTPGLVTPRFGKQFTPEELRKQALQKAALLRGR